MKKILIVSVLSFALNFVWEISQMSLYGPHFSGTLDFILVHVRASLGDILMVFLAFMADDLVFSRIVSGRYRNAFRTFFVACVGFVLAVLVEKYALSTGRWSYASAMPIIPWLRVGLTPISQMILIPPIVFRVWLRLREDDSP